MASETQEQYIARLEKEVKERIHNAFGTTKEAEAFFVNMVSSFHSTRGGALMRISDYLDSHNL